MRPFRFGVQYMRAQSAAEWRDKARGAEATGYATLVIPDHFMWDVSVFPALQSAADVTTRLHVGSMVLCNDFRHPLVTARDAASVHFLSEGRFELGIGAGWSGPEYLQAGIPFDAAGVRIDRFEEGLDVIERAFSGQSFDYNGRYYRVKDYSGHPPLRPPLVIGGGGPRMLGLAGRRADIVSITFKLDKGMDANTERFDDALLARKIGWLRDGAAAHFDQIELCLMIFWGGVTDRPLDAVAEGARAMGCEPAQALDMPSFLFGSEQALEEKLQRLREQFGISYFVFSEFGVDLPSLAPLVGRLSRA